MFLAVVIPQSRKDRKVLAAVAVSFACSWAAGAIPALASLSSGTRTIMLTISISAVFAWLFPHADTDGEGGRSADEKAQEPAQEKGGSE
jgi:hypothetical protein